MIHYFPILTFILFLKLGPNFPITHYFIIHNEIIIILRKINCHQLHITIITAIFYIYFFSHF